MSLFRYFQEDDSSHSKSNAYLLSLLSELIYDSSALSLVGGDFETRLARLLSRLSAGVDGEELSLQPFTLPPTQDFPYDTQAAVLLNDRYIVVVFRGTEGAPVPMLNPLAASALKDWLTNVQAFVMVKPSNNWVGAVHRGFHNALDQRYAQIRDAVKSARNKQQKVFLTGHSLGGALATLCAYRFSKFSAIDVAGVYTFGAPRVGNIEWRSDYDIGQGLHARTFRWVRGRDFAAALPFVPDPPGRLAPPPQKQYFHVGQLNYVTSAGSFGMSLDNPDLLPEIGPTTAASLALLSTGDHSMPQYCRSMYERVSAHGRQSASQPHYLVKGDIAAAMGIR